MSKATAKPTKRVNDVVHGINEKLASTGLAISWKDILTWCDEEGIDEAHKPKTGASSVSLGLAESLMNEDWEAFVKKHPDREVPAPKKKSKKSDASAEETGEPAATAEAGGEAKPRRRGKKGEEHKPEAPTTPPVEEHKPAEVPAEQAPAVPEEAPAEPVVPVKAEPVAPEVPAPAAEAPTPVEPAAPAPEAPVAETPAPAAKVEAPVEPKPATPEAPPAAPEPPAGPQTPAHQPGAQQPAAHKPPVKHGPRVPSPTIRIQSATPTPPVRKSKPTVFIPAPAQIQGPRVVRVEQEETVNIGPRAPRGPRFTNDDRPSVTPAAPRGGRGVKVTEEEEGAADKDKKKGRSLSSRRRGADGRRGEALEKLKEYTDADLLERQERLAAATGYRSSVDSHMKRRERIPGQPAKSVVQKGEAVEIEEPITVRSLSSALGLKTSDIMGKLMRQGVFATVNQSLDVDTATMLALEWGIELKIYEEPTLEEQLMAEFDSRVADEKDLVARPPVVTILGHVDHGKTSLLDKIRNANVAAGEAGGITQHTAAWMVELQTESGTKRVTFIDTPGHQAFTAMRARGANMTDVIVLVVSAAEGVQPQTVESINHAKAAGVPIVVALNKIDRADANPEMVLGQLAKEGLNAVEWGGDTEVIRTSAVTGQGIKELIEMLDYQSELLQLKTDPTAPARGSVIESRMSEGLGATATVLVQDGKIEPGDVLLCGRTFGKVRRLLNDRNEAIPFATASMPVVVSGLNGMPGAGDKVFELDDLDRARQICEERETTDREKELGSKGAVSLENLLDTIKQEDMKEVRLVIKADVAGSVETLEKAVVEASTEEVRVRVIHAAAGPITESDIELADASKAVIIGFNVSPDESARAMAEQRRIEVRQYRVIYEILDDLKKALSGMLEPEIREKYHGRSEIRQVFKVSRLGNIAGCMVIDGHIQRGSKIRLIRDGRILVEELSLESLRRGKEDAKEVKQGFECGMKLAGYDDVKEGDILEAYVRETIQRTL